MSGKGWNRYDLRYALYTKLESAVREKASDDHADCSRAPGVDSSGGGSCAEEQAIPARTTMTTTATVADYPFPLLWFEEMTPADLDSYHRSSHCQHDAVDQPAHEEVAHSSTSPSSAPKKRRKDHGRKKRSAAMATGGEGLGAEVRTAAAVPASLTRFIRKACDKNEMTFGNSAEEEDIREVRAKLTEQPGACHDMELMAESSHRASVRPDPPSRYTMAPTAATPVIDIPPAPRPEMEHLVSSHSTHNGRPSTTMCSLKTCRSSQQHALQRTATATNIRGNLEACPVVGASQRGHTAVAILPPALSQVTQQSVQLLSSLPSQVMLTQWGNSSDSVSWQEDSEEEEEEEEAEEEAEVEEALRSEYVSTPPPQLSPSRAHPWPNANATKGSVIEDNCFGRDDGTAREMKLKQRQAVAAATAVDSVHICVHSNAHPTGLLSNMESLAHGPQERLGQFEAFTQLLLQTFGEGAEIGAGQSDWSVNDQPQQQQSPSATLRPSRREQGLVMLPTDEALPRGIRGGQSGAVALLENNLRRVRERGTSEGYTARALELACHVLRQPKVCARREERITQEISGHGGCYATRAVTDHAEVVGVAGFIWEILRSEEDGPLKLHASEGRNKLGF